MNIQLLPLREEETVAFKEEIQKSFQHGFLAYYKEDESRNGRRYNTFLFVED